VPARTRREYHRLMPPTFARLGRAVPELDRRLPAVALIILSACSFSPSALGPDPDGDAGPPGDGVAPVDADPGAPDADNRPGIPRDVVHVPEGAWLPGDTKVAWTQDVDIETTLLDISGPGAEGMPELMFVDSPQEPEGPELAILYVASLAVAEGVTVRVTGVRPLVVIASGDIELRGVIDAGAHGVEPGPGGGDFLFEPGLGAGEDGAHAEQFLDSGGGGAGHATAGARGGHGCQGECDDDPRAEGAPGGSEYGDPAVTVLAGGSSGGLGGAVLGFGLCLPGAGGAGGGAVQLYAVGTITVAATGGINAGGGGGEGGLSDDCSDSGAGGGGSGGVVYLQAGTIALAGILAANGGGGGSEGGDDTADGMPGADGALGAVPASGGMAAASDSAGGDGAAGNAEPEPGADVDATTGGGGGGGAAGYVVLHCNDFSGGGLVSPTPHRTEGCSLL
jgi:hypothetical protein